MPIRFGEHSYRVKQLQECLKYLKYKIEVDGYYGEETLKVVQKFKAKHGLNSTGAVAEKTIAALRKAVK
jgi:peptidoglycan hydrolase-like protein with peptidoglycan-binding domain